MNVEYAIGCKQMQQDMTEEVIKDNQKEHPTVTVDDYDSCHKYFRIIDYWNEQIRNGMGWNKDGKSVQTK